MLDAYLIPVSISYECLLERNFNNELLGKPKIPESCLAFIKAIWSLFFGAAGDVQMVFAEPILLSVSIGFSIFMPFRSLL